MAYLTAAYRADLGVMISASHNPMPDNGIKIFGPGGHKLDDDAEDRIEELVAQGPGLRPVGAQIGRVRRAHDALDRYLDHIVAAAGTRLDGLTVVVDCANGAAFAAAPRAYAAAGARVIAINAEPDGLNINDGCGSTHLDQLRSAVVTHGADLGLAHDGDADRCLAVDAAGEVVDGDAIMTVIALAMREAGELAADTLVTTVMSNMGLHLAMREAGIAVRTTAVGDRYVLEELQAGRYSLGGEQSGHIVLPAFGTTGDGILTGLRLMSRMAQTRPPWRSWPPDALTSAGPHQRGGRRQGQCRQAPAVRSAVSQAEAELGDTGRILLRPSGTEQIVRVMVEAADEDTARQALTGSRGRSAPRAEFAPEGNRRGRGRVQSDMGTTAGVIAVDPQALRIAAARLDAAADILLTARRTHLSGLRAEEAATAGPAGNWPCGRPPRRCAPRRSVTPTPRCVGPRPCGDGRSGSLWRRWRPSASR